MNRILLLVLLFSSCAPIVHGEELSTQGPSDQIPTAKPAALFAVNSGESVVNHAAVLAVEIQKNPVTPDRPDLSDEYKVSVKGDDRHSNVTFANANDFMGLYINDGSDGKYEEFTLDKKTGDLRIASMESYIVFEKKNPATSEKYYTYLKMLEKVATDKYYVDHASTPIDKLKILHFNQEFSQFAIPNPPVKFELGIPPATPTDPRTTIVATLTGTNVGGIEVAQELSGGVETSMVLDKSASKIYVEMAIQGNLVFQVTYEIGTSDFEMTLRAMDEALTQSGRKTGVFTLYDIREDVRRAMRSSQVISQTKVPSGSLMPKPLQPQPDPRRPVYSTQEDDAVNDKIVSPKYKRIV